MKDYANHTLHEHNEHMGSDELFALRNIRPTSVRVLVLNELERADCALSLSDLEGRLATVDKSSIFRTLTLFLSHHLVHCVEDGTGMTKYALCSPNCHCGETHNETSLNDLHTHFRCERCGRTFCLRGLPVPSVPLPKGFKLTSANYVLVGLCPECSHIL